MSPSFNPALSAGPSTATPDNETPVVSVDP